MDQQEAREVLREHGVMIDIDDHRSPIEIAQSLIDFGTPASRHLLEIMPVSDETLNK